MRGTKYRARVRVRGHKSTVGRDGGTVAAAEPGGSHGTLGDHGNTGRSADSGGTLGTAGVLEELFGVLNAEHAQQVDERVATERLRHFVDPCDLEFDLGDFPVDSQGLRVETVVALLQLPVVVVSARTMVVTGVLGWCKNS